MATGQWRYQVWQIGNGVILNRETKRSALRWAKEYNKLAGPHNWYYVKRFRDGVPGSDELVWRPKGK